MKKFLRISNGLDSFSIPYKIICDGCGKEIESGQYNEYISDMIGTDGYPFTSVLHLCNNCLTYFLKSDKIGKNIYFTSCTVPKLAAFFSRR